MIRRPIC